MSSTSVRPQPTPTKVTCAVCELHAEAVFRVEGMDCHEEVVILERRLKPLVGVEAMTADVIGQRLHVQYDAAKLTTADMVDAVGQTGMRMWLEHEEPRTSGPDVRARFWLTVGAGVALMAGVGLPHAAIREQVADALDLVVHQARLADGTRRVVAVAEVVRVAGGPATRELFGWRAGRPRWRAALSDALAERLAA